MVSFWIKIKKPLGRYVLMPLLIANYLKKKRGITMKTIFKTIFKTFTASLLLVLLAACGSNQSDSVETQLSTGIATTTKTADFGKAASAQDIAAMSAKLGAYFNGKNANNPQALTGVKSATASVNAASTATPMIAASNVASPVFRFYNVNTGAHFFTMSTAERETTSKTASHSLRLKAIASLLIQILIQA